MQKLASNTLRSTILSERISPLWRERAPDAWLNGWHPQPFPVAGGALEGIDVGSGPPLVMLPPLPGWKEAFVALVPLLARALRVITFDLRAIGGDGARGAAAWDALVADAHEIAMARVGGPVTVFGHSLGGALALRWALRHPEQVKALVLSSTFARVFTPRGAYAARYVEQPIALAGMRWSTEAASRALARRLARRNVWMFDPRCDEAIVELIRCGVRHVSLGMTRRCLSLAFAHDVRTELAGLRCPVLIVTGEIDTAFALAAADELGVLIPHARRATVHEAGHLHPLSHPEALSRIVTEWVADPR